MGFRVLVSLHPAIQATGRLTLAPAGLPPAEHTSLHWTHNRTCTSRFIRLPMFDRWQTSRRPDLVHGLLLLPDGFSWPVASVEQRSPFGPAPLQSLRPYYEPLRPCAPHRYSRPRGFSRLRLLPLHRSTGSHVPYKSLVELRAASMPDAAWAVSGIPQADPEGMATPRFWHHLIRFRHVISGLLALASLNLA